MKPMSDPIASWDEYFDWVRTLDLPNYVLRERDQPEDNLRDLPRSSKPVAKWKKKDNG